MHGHVAIIMKPSPPFLNRDVYIAMFPGLLPIFLHVCEIKSGSGLRTSLGLNEMYATKHYKHEIVYTMEIELSCVTNLYNA